MNEKRFTMRYGKYIDNVENIEYDEKWESWKICGLLNELAEENNELKRQVKEIIFGINVLIDVSAPNTERIGLLLDLKEKMIETFGEWAIE